MNYIDRSKQLNSLRSAFNEKIKMVPNFSEFNNEIQSKKASEYKSNVFNDYESKLESLKTYIGKDIETANRKINEARYPMMNSLHSTDRLIGATELNTAQIFLNTSQPAWLMIKSVKDAFESNRIDYASAILDKITSQPPANPLSKIEKSSAAQASLINDLKAISEEFMQKAGITDHVKDVNELNALINKINRFTSLLKNRHEFIFFTEDVAEMTEDEKRQVKRFLNSLPAHESIRLKNQINVPIA